MKLVYKANRDPGKGRGYFSPSKTETQGYIPPRIQIESMLRAGRQLNEYRKQMFQGVYDGSDDFDIDLDPTRSPNFDMADATQIDRAVTARLKQQKKAAEDKAEALKKEEQEKKKVVEDPK